MQIKRTMRSHLTQLRKAYNKKKKIGKKKVLEGMWFLRNPLLLVVELSSSSLKVLWRFFQKRNRTHK